MDIDLILTKRKYQKHPSFQLVYEWEDVFCEYFNSKYRFDPNISILAEKLGKFYDHFPVGTTKSSFLFEMNPDDRTTCHNNRPNVIPCLIDFYLYNERDLDSFYRRYSKNKLVLISSLEVYDYLKSKSCPLNIKHLALSISDKYKLTNKTSYKKSFDVLLMGRQNPVLLQWLRDYLREHPSIIVVSSKKENGHFNYYTNSGVFVGNADSRDGMIKLLKQSRIGLYSTKGIDGDYKNKETNGFSQVTPRFLENIAFCNHIIARYKDNKDSQYYEINKISPHTDSYQDFAEQMEKALETPVDIQMYSQYLEKHYTSVRAAQLNEYIKQI